MALLWPFFHPAQGKRLYHAALLFYHIRMKHAQNESHHLLAKLLLMPAPVLVHQENFLLAGIPPTRVAGITVKPSAEYSQVFFHQSNVVSW